MPHPTLLPVQWLITTDLGANSDVGAYARAVRNAGGVVWDIALQDALTPGWLPDAPTDRPTIAHGSVGFTAAIQRSGRWTPGVFGTPERFCYDAWAQHYGALLLNSPDSIERVTPQGFLDAWAQGAYKARTDLFVRPDQDTKSLVGAVWTPHDFAAQCRRIVAGGLEGIDAQTGLLVGEPFGIEAEWRVFMVEGQPVAASQYVLKGRLTVERGAPDRILDFAKAVAHIWTPAPVFTLDICVSNGRPYIMEAQGFNSAGVYAADLDVLMPAVHKAAYRVWQQKHEGNKA